ncbi:MAG TPA: hypothetical protein VFP89_04245 [Propionibacteriaceae bacterium]|nr:hypothetical protein [Propionibacteriaceae bacterium]
MTDAPHDSTSDDSPGQPDTAASSDAATTEDAPGAEIGVVEGEGSSFEPEEDPQA